MDVIRGLFEREIAYYAKEQIDRNAEANAAATVHNEYYCKGSAYMAGDVAYRLRLLADKVVTVCKSELPATVVNVASSVDMEKFQVDTLALLKKALEPYVVSPKPKAYVKNLVDKFEGIVKQYRDLEKDDSQTLMARAVDQQVADSWEQALNMLKYAIDKDKE
jgi:hypothetical protein